MSVKMMTTEQLQNDLSTTFNMWGGGIPPEQVDRVNALRAELKRRGATEQASRPEMPQPRGIESMTDDQLGAELRALSDRIGKNPSDEDLQTRFADVRFELRKRQQPKKTGAFDPVTGETDMHKAATNGNGSNGHDERLVPRQVPLVQDPEAAARVETMKADFVAKQEARQREIEAQQAQMLAMARKHNLAKIAADVASNILTKYDISNVDGDVIENACTIATQVAQNIFVKVGL
jgi:hypothetical protein